jgi:hypothetical protein
VGGIVNGWSVGKLFEHDAMIVVKEVRLAFSAWTDRLLAAVLLVGGLDGIHQALAPQPMLTAALEVSAVAAVIGIAVARLVHGRLAFQAYDGVLAIEALCSRSRWRYSISCHALAAAATGVVVLAARPDVIAFALPAFLAGATAGTLVGLLGLGRDTRFRRFLGPIVRTRLHAPGAGMLAAAIVLTIAFSGRTLDTVPRLALVGTASVCALLALTSVDDAVIRFMTISGYRSWRIVAVRAQGALVFCAITVGACLVGSLPLEAGIVGLMVAIGLLLMIARILVYRVHPKRSADLIVVSCLVVAGLVGFTVPIMLPFVTAAILWQLHRHSSAKTWLLA